MNTEMYRVESPTFPQLLKGEYSSLSNDEILSDESELADSLFPAATAEATAKIHNALKKELYPLLSQTLIDAWPHVLSIRSQCETELRNNKTVAAPRQQLKFGSVAVNLNAEVFSKSQRYLFVSHYMNNILKIGFRSWERASKQNKFANTEAQSRFQKVFDLLHQKALLDFRLNMNQLVSDEHTMGTGTAINTFTSITKMIEPLFVRDQHRQPTQEELRAAFHGSRNLIFQLAMSNIDQFTYLRDILHKDSFGQDFFNPTYFVLKERSPGQFEIAFNVQRIPDLITMYPDLLAPVVTETIGCPAVLARLPDHPEPIQKFPSRLQLLMKKIVHRIFRVPEYHHPKEQNKSQRAANLIQYLFDWYEELISEYYFSAIAINANQMKRPHDFIF